MIKSEEKLKNKIGMQIGFLLHSGKSEDEVIQHLFEIATDYVPEAKYTTEQVIAAMIWAEDNGKDFTGSDYEGRLKQFGDYLAKI